MTTIQTLEFLKYFTLLGKPIGFPNKSGQFLDYVTKEENITTPEGYQFTIRQFRINWGEVLSNMKSNNFCDQYFCFDLRNNNYWTDTPNPENHIRENNQKPFASGSNQYIRYLFYSNHYYKEREKNPNWHMQMVNQYDNILYINEKGESYYPFSLIISIKADRQTDFDDFLKLKKGTVQIVQENGQDKEIFEEGTWIYYFNEAYKKATINGDFNLLLNYPSKVIYDALINSNNQGVVDIKKIKSFILMIIAYWSGLFSGVSYDNKKNFLFGLLEGIKKENAEEIYDIFFDTEASSFRKLNDVLEDEDMYKLNVLLIKFFFWKQTPAELENIKQQIRNNTDINKVIPIIQSNLGIFKEIGTSPKIYYDNYFVNISFVDTNIVEHNGNNAYVRNFGASSDNPFYYLMGKKYDYDEIVFGLAMMSKLEAGITPGKIIPLPAFALDGINKVLSDSYTLIDVLKDVAFSIGFIMPFFTMAESISLGLATKLEIFTGTLGLFKSVSDNFLDNYLRPYLLADPKGAEFLKQYYFISTLYNTKDIVKTFVERGYDVLVDYEFLLSAWSTYQDTNSYLNIDQQNANFIRIKNELKIIQETYETMYNK